MRKQLTGYLILLFLNGVAVAQKLPANGRNNETYVWLYNTQGRLTRIFPLAPAIPEIRNRQFNISVADSSGNMLQLNGMKAIWLKDTAFTSRSLNVVLMRRNGTWTSQAGKYPVQVTIRCAGNKPGNPVRVLLKSMVAAKGKARIRVQAQLISLLPESQMNQLNTN